MTYTYVDRDAFIAHRPDAATLRAALTETERQLAEVVEGLQMPTEHDARPLLERRAELSARRDRLQEEIEERRL